jgi:hypothetical protein
MWIRLAGARIRSMEVGSGRRELEGTWIRPAGAGGCVDLAGGRHNIISTPSPSIFFFCFFHPQSETRPKVCLSPFSCNWRHAPARLGLAYILRCDFGNAFVPRLYLDFGNVSSACFSSSAYLMT